MGIDLVEIARVASVLEKHGLAYLEKIFTHRERSYCDGRHTPALHYAARFAAKEAAAKALGTGIGKDAAWLDLEVVTDERGAPQIILGGAAKDFAKAHGIRQIHISLTHTDTHAAANAIALTGE